MQLKVNGELREVESSGNLLSLLETLKLINKPVAVEHNRVIISPEEYAKTPLAPGDELEIVHFVGGG